MCSICDVNTVSNGHHDPSMVSCNRRERLIMMIDNDRKNYVECSPGELYKDVFIGLCGSSVHLMWIECPLEVNRVSFGSESNVQWMWIEYPLVHMDRVFIVDLFITTMEEAVKTIDLVQSLVSSLYLYIALISIYIYLYIALSAVIRII